VFQCFLDTKLVESVAVISHQPVRKWIYAFTGKYRTKLILEIVQLNVIYLRNSRQRY
jgi:uncharacterized PurR-regulated membrane protein YhhQ (DUF165 family)